MALLCYEANEQHDPEHSDKVEEVLESLQKQLNVRSFLIPSCSDILLPIVNLTPPLSSSLPCLPHLSRLEMVTWFVCGSWLGNAWLNMPPPSALGQTAAGFAGLFREELHVT